MGTKIRSFDCYIDGKFYCDYVDFKQFNMDFPQYSHPLVSTHLNGKTVQIGDGMLLIPHDIPSTDKYNRLMRYMFKIINRDIKKNDAKLICQTLNKYFI